MKKIILILITLYPIVNFGQANKIIRQATRETDLDKKIALYTEAIALEPNNLDAYFYRALAKNDLGDFSGAIVDYSKIIVEEPDADTYYNRGNSRYSIKDFSGAKEDYAKAFLLDDNFLDALYSLACVKFDLEEFEDAVKDFSNFIKRVPTNPTAYTLRASAYKALEQYTKAAEDYSTAILIEPSADNYYNRGVFLMDLNYHKEAHVDLTKSLKLNKNNSYAYFYRGASNLLLGQHLDAIKDFSTAVEFDSVDFDAYLGLAMAYNKVNDAANAKINFDRANAIISPDKAITSIQQYANTYWFQTQYYFLNSNINDLVKLN
ncbi:tetratricopeptide repeat protein [Sabulilitoribacter multivorans]|uniref:Tetratricopeptide repeat protein n=1 Tax=Flaviramulus multivorans TaxID=1304750 RepID=A0ABS9IK52_9FLAO|nr:tetratricopeptide repeat protein [Flaviramulus multivorans]MCF7560960.1 tetratricopeptide repeat protein [Flaviramulus multivorans]